MRHDLTPPLRLKGWVAGRGVVRVRACPRARLAHIVRAEVLVVAEVRVLGVVASVVWRAGVGGAEIAVRAVRGGAEAFLVEAGVAHGAEVVVVALLGVAAQPVADVRPRHARR